MFDNANELLKAIKRNRFTGVILYEGPSAIDGAPVVVIANRIETASGNAKTGAMVQTFIIRADVNPYRARGLVWGAIGLQSLQAIHKRVAVYARRRARNIPRSRKNIRRHESGRLAAGRLRP